MGAVVASLMDTSRCVAVHAARHRSVHAWRERLRRGVEGPAASAWAVDGASAVGVAGIGPGSIDRHGWSSEQLVMHMR
jgi:hypothetical protein